MRKILGLTLASLLVASLAWAGPTLPDACGRMVCDTLGKLSASEVSALDTKLRAYETRTTNEIAVVTANVGDTSIEEYTTRLFEKWGIGKKDKHNGVMILWAPDVRKVRIEVGYGLEGILPDGRAGDIWRQNMLPLFKQNAFAAGLNAGVDAVITQLDREPIAPAPPTPASSDSDVQLVIILVALGLAVVVGAIVIVVYRKKKAEEDAERDRAIREAYTHMPSTPLIYHTEPVREKSVIRQAPVVTRKKRNDDDDEPSYRSRSSYSSYNSSSSSYDSGSSSSFDFGGGSSGGGGATGSY